MQSLLPRERSVAWAWEETALPHPCPRVLWSEPSGPAGCQAPSSCSGFGETRPMKKTVQLKGEGEFTGIKTIDLGFQSSVAEIKDVALAYISLCGILYQSQALDYAQCPARAQEPASAVAARKCPEPSLVLPLPRVILALTGTMPMLILSPTPNLRLERRR